MKKVTDAYLQPNGLFKLAACGLDNVYLTNGYNLNEDDTAYSLNDLDGLYEGIAHILCDRGEAAATDNECVFVAKHLKSPFMPVTWVGEIKDNNIVMTHRGD